MVSNTAYHSASQWTSFLETHNGEYWSSALTSNGQYLVTGGQDKTVRIWDLQTKSQVSVLQGHTSNIKGVAVSASSKYILSGSLDKTVKLWDFHTKTLEFNFKGHQNSVFCVCFADNELLAASGSQDRSIIVWDLIEKTAKFRFQGHNESVKSVFFVNDQNLLSGSFDKTVKIWNLNTLECKNIEVSHKVMSVCAAVHKNLGFCGGDEGGIKAFCLDSGNVVAELNGHTGGIRALAVGQNGDVIVSASSDKTVRLWDLSNFGLIQVFSVHSAEVNGVCINQSSNLIASVSFDCSISIYSPQSATAEKIQLSSYYEDSLSFYPPFLSYGSDNNSLKLWDFSTNSLYFTFQGHTKRVVSTILPNTQFIYSGSSDCTIRKWDIQLRTQISELQTHQSPISSISLSEDLKFLVSGSNDKTIQIWDFDNKTLLNTLTGHKAPVSSVCVSSIRNKIFSASMDCSVRTWNLGDGELIEELKIHNEKVWKIALTVDGKYLVTGAYFEFVAVVELDSGQVVAKITSAEEGEEWFAKYEEIRKWFLRYV